MTDNAMSLQARDLVRVYRRGNEEICALDGVSLAIRRGEFVSFMGPSGCAKTTLINLLGCLDNPSAGELTLAGRTIFGKGKHPCPSGSSPLLRREGSATSSRTST